MAEPVPPQFRRRAITGIAVLAMAIACSAMSARPKPTRLTLPKDISVEEADRLAKKLTVDELVARIAEAHACRMGQTRSRLAVAALGVDPFEGMISDKYIYERLVYVMKQGPSRLALKLLPNAAKADMTAIRKGDFATCWIPLMIALTRKEAWRHHQRKLRQYRNAAQKFADALAIARNAAIPEADRKVEVPTGPDGKPVEMRLTKGELAGKRKPTE